MWPGRARSSARVSGRMQSWMVRERSAAEMPVLTPCRASMDSVKAVPKFEVFLGDISGRPRASHRSALIAKQIKPRP